MKASHITTPRNLAECTFVTGYTSADLTPETRFERSAGYLLAVLIGVALAGCLFYGLSK